MSIQVSDPLQLLPYQSGAVTSPREESAANASASLTGPQQTAKIGEPVPIVFCRRRNNNGGVFVSPKATEGRYENGIIFANIAENPTTSLPTIQEFLDVKLCLVISEGDMSQLKLNDMFYGECKSGTYAQTYGRRAGTWIPGNFIDDYLASTTAGNSLPSPRQAGESYYMKDIGKIFYAYTNVFIIKRDHISHDCPEYCGTSGSYDNMTVVSFEKRLLNLDDWNKQIHVFVREGMKVTRLVDSTLGASDNFVDLAKYLIEKSSAVPSDLIDNTLLTSAANFCEANSFFYNGKLEKSVNLSDWMQAHAHFFLLRFSKVNGKFAFRPTLPVNANHTIKTTTVSYKYGFTESDLLPDGFEIQYISLSERNAVIMQMMWREQPSGDIGFARTTNVKFSGTSSDGPFEQHDLSLFCTNEDHAVKVGAYMLSRRRNIMHNLRITVRPGSHSSILSIGDIARVRLRRETAVDQVEYHDFLYEIDRIEKTSTGPITYDLTHFPIDSQGRSVVALDVAGATGPGIVLDAGRQNFDCDENTAATDLPNIGRGTFDGTNDPGGGGVTPDTPLDSDVNQDLTPEGNNDPNSPDYFGNGGSSAGNAFPAAGGALPGGSNQPGAINNPADPYEEPPADPDEEPPALPTIQGYTGTPVAGDTLTFDPGCVGAFIKWYLIDANTGVKTQVSSGVAQPYIVSATAEAAGVAVFAEGACPDPGSPSGYGLEITDTLNLPDTNLCWHRATPTFVQYFNEGSPQQTPTWTSSFGDENFVLPTSQVSKIISYDGQKVTQSTNPFTGVTTTYYQAKLTLQFFDGTVAQVTNNSFTQFVPHTAFRLFDNNSQCLSEGSVSQFVFYYLDDNGNSSGFNSTSTPTFSAPYSINSSVAFAYYDVTTTNCDGSTNTSPAIAYGPSGNTPSFTYSSQTFVANCS